ncbi:single-stranded DNA-binding protein [uncultured Bifidobacterium sp.]|uniref:single-stranded DNA-binding protein n=1 Tax=uncultured Bifidobacterium sp. TaxID=165187 RepID=UPI0028DC312D|nr:single-stranded DNA-binding protein [uncultured Bifidobacterium sp.]
MAQQGAVVITGYVGAEPTSFGRQGGTAACSFRLGSTRRFFHPGDGAWRDHPTVWITVKAFRTLAVNVESSLHRGDPVIVTGTLASEEWTKEGVVHSSLVLEASSIGHDLSRGTSAFTRSSPGRQEDGIPEGDLPRVAADGPRQPEPVGVTGDAGDIDGFDVGVM